MFSIFYYNVELKVFSFVCIIYLCTVEVKTFPIRIVSVQIVVFFCKFYRHAIIYYYCSIKTIQRLKLFIFKYVVDNNEDVDGLTSSESEVSYTDSGIPTETITPSPMDFDARISDHEDEGGESLTKEKVCD